MVGSATELATFDPEMAARIKRALRQVEIGLRDLIQLGQSDGSIPERANAAAVARALVCLLQGLRVIAKAGLIRADAVAVVEQAMHLVT